MPCELDSQVIAGLEIHPESVGSAQCPGQPQRRIRTDGSLTMHYLVDPARRNAYRLRQPVLTDVEWAEKLLEQDLTRMNRLMHAFRDQFLPSQ